MGRVVASFRILPTGTDVKLDNLKNSIKDVLPKETSAFKFEEEPIAFGLVALHAHIVMPEEVSGEMDKIEEILTKVEGVSQIDVTMVRRI